MVEAQLQNVVMSFIVTPDLLSQTNASRQFGQPLAWAGFIYLGIY